MALINCPSCRTKISSLAKVCPNCNYSQDPDAEIDPEQVALFKKRMFRDRMYKLRMFSYVAMSITMIGALPMLWDYIRGMETGDSVILLKHWGVYAVGLGFVMYMVIRFIMVQSRRRYRATKN